MLDFSDYKLGGTKEEIDINTAEHHRLAALQMVQQGRNSVDIISRQLDPHAYNTPEFVEAIKQLALNNRRAQIRAMVFESVLIRRQGHLLLNLSEKLPSFIKLRKPYMQHKNFNESLLLVDNTAFVLRPNAERFEGKVNFNDKRQAQALSDMFEEVWSRAKPDPDLMRMHL